MRPDCSGTRKPVSDGFRVFKCMRNRERHDCVAARRLLRTFVLIGRVILGSVALLAPMLAIAQGPRPVRLNDSDWWSVLRKYISLDFSRSDLNVQRQLPTLSNFEISRTSLGEKQLQTLAAQLGQARLVERGDAAAGRSQVCYASTSKSPQVRLIFEQGSEGSVFSFYLFEDGPNWEGDRYCVKSPQISMNLRTASGLQLGEEQSSVEAILGKASIVAKDKLVYVYEARKQTPANRLSRLRERHRDLSDEEFHRAFDFYFADAYIEARFTNSKLSYLAVVRSDTFP